MKAKSRTQVQVRVTAKKQAEVFNGYTVADMPGQSPMDKAMNFALFKRGKIKVEYIKATKQERAEMNGHGNNFVVALKKRKLRALQRAEATTFGIHHPSSIILQ